MYDLTQLSLSNRDTPASEPQTPSLAYSPPPIDQLNQFSHTVCLELTQRDSAGSPDTDLLRGFSSFIQVVVKAHTTNMNVRRAENSRGETHVKQEEA